MKLMQLTRSKTMRFILAFISMFAVQYAMAGGGLEAAKTEATNLKVWGYALLGILVFLYLMYHVAMALMDKKPWADVVMAVVYVAAAGAVLVVGTWAWGIWGTATAT